MKYHNLFFLKSRKNVAKFVVCCSCDWRFKGQVRKRCMQVSLTLLRPMEFPIKFDTIKSGWSIVYIEGSQVIISSGPEPNDRTILQDPCIIY